LAALTQGAFRFLRSARVDQVDVEVVNPEEEGWNAPVTIIRAEVRDRPFIVDTIRESLAGANLPTHHYVYPVIGIVRDTSGAIVQVTEPSKADPRAIVHCEVPRIPEAERREDIRREIERRLRDVVAATDDFEPMLAALRDTIQMVEGYAANQ